MANGNVIDLRSDTVTKPTAAMRAAMAAAEVGDDVYGEDPTVNRLEQRAAEVFGREASIYSCLPGRWGIRLRFAFTRSMGRRSSARRNRTSSTGRWRWFRPSRAVCRAQSRAIGGVLSWESIRRAIAPKIYYRAPTGLIAVENTHNMAGGTVTPVEVFEEIWEGAREAKLPVHLDGARIFNAATALGVDVPKLTRGFDTVMFCFVEGLGAPVGSMLVGSREVIERARVFRKSLGGGMRQAGVLAAAGLIALGEMSKRLGEDHANARLLAEAIARCDAKRSTPRKCRPNIVIFTLRDDGDAAGLVRGLRENGVLASAIGSPRRAACDAYDVGYPSGLRACRGCFGAPTLRG